MLCVCARSIISISTPHPSFSLSISRLFSNAQQSRWNEWICVVWSLCVCNCCKLSGKFAWQLDCLSVCLAVVCSISLREWRCRWHFTFHYRHGLPIVVVCEWDSIDTSLIHRPSFAHQRNPQAMLRWWTGTGTRRPNEWMNSKARTLQSILLLSNSIWS